MIQILNSISIIRTRSSVKRSAISVIRDDSFFIPIFVCLSFHADR